jgi:hypothetical protein
LYKVTPEQFNAYATACRKKGLVFDITESDSVFYADNEEGYDLNIFYYKSKKEMHVSIVSYNVNLKHRKENTYGVIWQDEGRRIYG